MKECKYTRIFKFYDLLTMLFWSFVLIAWIFPETALFNILFLLPLVYFIHILPFHPFEIVKNELCPDELKKSKESNTAKGTVNGIQDKFSKFCTFSPISHQGFMLFGFISSILSLYIRGYIKLNNNNTNTNTK